jgi:uncharacterized iron-regulated protein
VAEDEDCCGSEAHFNVFESTMTGRSDSSIPPQEDYREMFQAQVLKDAAMAHKVRTILNESDKDDKIFLLCGEGHMSYGYGVPERIWKTHPETKEETFMLYTR